MLSDDLGWICITNNGNTRSRVYQNEHPVLLLPNLLSPEDRTGSYRHLLYYGSRYSLDCVQHFPSNIPMWREFQRLFRIHVWNNDEMPGCFLVALYFGFYRSSYGSDGAHFANAISIALWIAWSWWWCLLLVQLWKIRLPLQKKFAISSIFVLGSL